MQLAVVIEDRPAQFCLVPRDGRLVRVVDVSAREYLVAIARRIEEIDRRAAREAVPRRTDFERHVMLRDKVGSLEHLVPRIEIERHVMESVLLPVTDERNVVWLVRA